MVLIPAVKELRFSGGTCPLDLPMKVVTGEGVGDVTAALLQNAPVEAPVDRRTDGSTGAGCAVALRIVASGKHRDAYRISVQRDAVTITGESEAGLFYGVQTLLQIIGRHGRELPCLEIDDAPDFSNRGFYHDVTRGKLPKLFTLQSLADKLAAYKINQLQLYIEHAFVFAAVPEFQEEFDLLTADDICAFDRYCRDRFIDLVPSMATFGHLYELLRVPRFEHLNELDVRASLLPRDLWDRMVHYTINPLHEESFPLVRSMLEEYCSLFSSRYVNICCDETFDLGKGVNRITAKKNGIGRLYVDFVKKIAGVVTAAGKVPMMWGDIVLHLPELIGELPPETVFLNWNYQADCNDSATRRFRDRGVRHYVCPGVAGWYRFANDIRTASLNIRRMVGFGKKYGAEGVLTTDWGDCGHVNFLSASFHGMALGAALSWNAASFPDDEELDAVLSSHEWKDGSRRLYSLLRELGSLCDYHFGSIYAWVNKKDCEWNRENEIAGWDTGALTAKYHRAREISEQVQRIAETASGSDFAELLWGAKAIQWTLALMVGKRIEAFGSNAASVVAPPELVRTAEQLRDEFAALWRGRNKESELRNVTAVFNKVVVMVAAWKII